MRSVWSGLRCFGGGGYSRAVERLRGHQCAPEMGSGDPEALPSGLHRRCAFVDPGSMSEDKVTLPVFLKSAIPFPCGAQRPMLDPEQGKTTSNSSFNILRGEKSHGPQHHSRLVVRNVRGLLLVSHK